jgi:Rieske Fe-S protein
MSDTLNNSGGPSTDDSSRRDFLTTTSAIAMAGGLVASYGTLGVMAGRYLYPAEDKTNAWQFAGLIDEITREQSLVYQSPGGARVVIARQGDGNTADDFVALSNVCPHLGCSVHWEPQNARFFCPCHNGAFDATGKATMGPPAAANQSLKKFPLEVAGNQLYIFAPVVSIVSAEVDADDPRARCRQGESEQGGLA